MRRSRSSALFLAAAAFAAAPARAQTTGTVEGGAFLLLPVGARATALGQAAAAERGTTEAMFWNPAGLADLKRSEIALHHYAIFAGVGDAFVVAIPAASIGTFSAAAYVLDYGEIPTNLGPGGTEGSAITRNIALEAGYSTALFGGLTAGLVYKLIQFRVDCTGSCPANASFVGTTHAFDFGVQYVLSGVPVELGAVIRNVGFKLQVNNQQQADPLPARLQVGVAWVLVRPPAPDVQSVDVRLLADVQGVIGQGDLAPTTMFGVESGVHEVLRVRAGYAFLDSQASGPSLGLGVQVGRVGIDLAKTFYAADAISERDPFHVSLRLMF